MAVAWKILCQRNIYNCPEPTDNPNSPTCAASAVILGYPELQVPDWTQTGRKNDATLNQRQTAGASLEWEADQTRCLVVKGSLSKAGRAVEDDRKSKVSQEFLLILDTLFRKRELKEESGAECKSSAKCGAAVHQWTAGLPCQDARACGQRLPGCADST